MCKLILKSYKNGGVLPRHPFYLGGPMNSTECETCWYYDYDEEYDAYYCMMDLDEDEVYRIMSSRSQHCPYYRQGDDYTLARRQ